MNYDNESRTGAGNLLTFFFGIAIGVAGTLVYAAINEDQFKRAVGKTRGLAGNLNESVGDYIDDAGNKIKSVRGKAQDAFEDSVASVKEKASDLADHVQKTARNAKSEINS